MWRIRAHVARCGGPEHAYEQQRVDYPIGEPHVEEGGMRQAVRDVIAQINSSRVGIQNSKMKAYVVRRARLERIVVEDLPHTNDPESAGLGIGIVSSSP